MIGDPRNGIHFFFLALELMGLWRVNLQYSMKINPPLRKHF